MNVLGIHVNKIFGLTCVFLLCMLPMYAQAQSDLEVFFETEPLFDYENLRPSDTVQNHFSVRNNGVDIESAYVLFTNGFDTGGVASVMDVAIMYESDVVFQGSLQEVFTKDEIPLHDITPSETKQYTVQVTLRSGIGNQYQSQETGFDFVVGFKDGESVVIEGTTSSTGGRGTNEVTTSVMISNEDVRVDGSEVIVTWNTNQGATSYLACSSMSNAPFQLETESPFGYEFVVEEDMNLVTSHQVQIQLQSGTYECRPASRTARNRPFTVGSPLVVIVEAPEGEVAGEFVTTDEDGDEQGVLIYGDEGSITGGGSGGGQAIFESDSLEEEEDIVTETDQDSQEPIDGEDTFTQAEVGTTTSDEQDSFYQRNKIVVLTTATVITGAFGYVVFRRFYT